MPQEKTDKKYIEIVRQMSGEQRLKAAQTLKAWARELIAASILEKNPKLNKRELEKCINQKFYSYER